MLDQETKQRIDTARQILVGKVPDPKAQVEQITTALVYKFMDDMDKESEELGGHARFFSGEYRQYSWSKLLDKRLSGQERLNLYVMAITEMSKNPNIPQLFRDIFKDTFLPYRDFETLNLFLKEINSFTYDHSENLGNAFEYLLSVLGSQGDAGQFRTPRHIIDFIVEVVDPKKNETVLDPACGTAGFLISAYKHIIKHNSSNYTPSKLDLDIDNAKTAYETVSQTSERFRGDLLNVEEKKVLMKNFTGYDISPDMVRLSLVNMYLHGFAEPYISEYDTLTYENYWDDSFDVILANPPFMTPKGGIRPHKRFQVQANRAEVLFVDYIAEHLSINGKAGIIVPEGIIFQSSNAYKDLRKMLIQDNYLYAVVSLPAGVFQPYSGVKTSILLLDRQFAKQSKDILFVKVSNDGFDLGAQRRKIDKNDLPLALQEIQNFKSKILGKLEIENSKFKILHIVSKDKIAENGEYNLTGDRYKEVVSYVGCKWEMVKLGDVCELESGSRQKGGALNFGIPSIGGEQIDENGNIKIEKMKYISFGYFQQMKKGILKDRDILVVKDGATTGKVGFYKGIFEKASVNEHVFIFRTNEKTDPYFLYSVIRSNNFKNILKRYIKGIIGGISLEIKEIQIPLPPLEVQKQIVEELDFYQKVIDGAREIVNNWKPVIKIDPSWEMVKLGDVCERITDGSHNSPSSVSDGFSYITVRDISDGVIDFNNCKKILEDDYEKLLKNGCQPFKGDILFSKDGTVGKVAHVKDDRQFVVLSSLAIITPDKETLNSEFLLNILQDTSILGSALGMMKGVAIKRVVLKDLKDLKVPLPPLETQKQIVSQIEEEQKYVDGCKKLIEIHEAKIKEKIAEVWGDG